MSSYLITCAQCGHKNNVGRLFCTQCGARLEIQDPRAAVKTKSGPGILGKLGSFLRLAVTLGLLVVVVQILRPVVPTGSDGSPQDAQRLVQKMRLLKGAVMDRKPMTQRILELEVNAYLEDLLAKSSDGNANTLDLKKINLSMDPGQLTVLLAAEMGPATITYELTGKAVHRSERFHYDIEKVRMGHLPVPPVVGNWLAGKLYKVFSRMEEERRLLDQMVRIDVGQGEAVVANQRE